MPSQVFTTLILASLLLTGPLHAKRGGIPLVVVDTVKQGPVTEEIPLTGTVTSPRVTNISSEVSGLVKTVHIDTGHNVNVGQTLITLNSELSSLDLKAARASTWRTREELADAQRLLADAQRLAKNNTISQSEVQSRTARVNIARASLQQQQAEEALREARLKRHTIKAPFSGAIIRKMTSPGEWITPGQTVAQLVDTMHLNIDFQIPQQLYPRLSESAALTLRFDAITGQEFPADIVAVVPFIDAATRTLLMRARLKQASTAIVPGMSSHGMLKLRHSDSGILIPRDAVLRYADGRITTWVVTGNAEKPVVTERPVQIGLTFQGMVQILEGLDAGEQVVVQGNESLRNNQAVRIHRP